MSYSRGQLGGQAAFVGFDEGTGVVGDQAAEHVAGLRGVVEVAGAVERVEAGVVQVGGVADVVQERRGGQQVRVRAEDRGEGAGLGGDALGMGPAAGQRFVQERAGGVFGPVG